MKKECKRKKDLSYKISFAKIKRLWYNGNNHFDFENHLRSEEICTMNAQWIYPFVLKTERLVLRSFQMNGLDDLYEYASVDLGI